MTTEWDEEVDLLVFGSGAGGLAAAAVAAAEGLSVLVCEKTDRLGGTTATSGGSIWVPGSTQSRATASPSDIDSARVYLDAVVGTFGDPALREVFLRTGAEALDYFEARTALKFKANDPYPDYRPDWPGGATGGRALTAMEIDGRELGADFGLVRPPIPEFMLFGGMMFARSEIKSMIRPWKSWSAFRISARNVGSYLMQRLTHRRGTRLLLGNAMIARLLLSLRRAGGDVRINAALADLVGDGTRIRGAVVDTPRGRTRIGARRGVVLATGGVSSSPAWRERLMAGTSIEESLTFEGATGDGVDAASRIGAGINTNHASPFFWMPASVLRRRNGSRTVFPHIRDRPKPGLIAVNRDGRRFVNEASSYQDFCAAMIASADNNPAYLVCDRRFLHNFGIGMIYPIWQVLSRFRRLGYLKSAPTLDGLAAEIGVDPAGLADAVALHNRDAADGRDSAFGKGTTALNRFNGDPDTRPNPCMAPIDRAPYFAVEVRPSPIGASVGLRTDGDARVLAEDGKVIPGLYACGNDMSSIMGGEYPGPGITLGPAIVFAYRAARHAAGAPPTPGE